MRAWRSSAPRVASAKGVGSRLSEQSAARASTASATGRARNVVGAVSTVPRHREDIPLDQSGEMPAGGRRGDAGTRCELPAGSASLSISASTSVARAGSAKSRAAAATSTSPLMHAGPGRFDATSAKTSGKRSLAAPISRSRVGGRPKRPARSQCGANSRSSVSSSSTCSLRACRQSGSDGTASTRSSQSARDQSRLAHDCLRSGPAETDAVCARPGMPPSLARPPRGVSPRRALPADGARRSAPAARRLPPRRRRARSSRPGTCPCRPRARTRAGATPARDQSSDLCGRLLACGDQLCQSQEVRADVLEIFLRERRVDHLRARTSPTFGMDRNVGGLTGGRPDQPSGPAEAPAGVPAPAVRRDERLPRERVVPDRQELARPAEEHLLVRDDAGQTH